MEQSSPFQPALQAHSPGGMQLPLIQSLLQENVKSADVLATMFTYSSAGEDREKECRDWQLAFVLSPPNSHKVTYTSASCEWDVSPPKALHVLVMSANVRKK